MVPAKYRHNEWNVAIDDPSELRAELERNFGHARRTGDRRPVASTRELVAEDPECRPDMLLAFLVDPSHYVRVAAAENEEAFGRLSPLQLFAADLVGNASIDEVADLAGAAFDVPSHDVEAQLGVILEPAWHEDLVECDTLEMYSSDFGRPHRGWLAPRDADALAAHIFVRAEEREREVRATGGNPVRDWDLGGLVKTLDRVKEIASRWRSAAGQPPAGDGIFTLACWEAAKRTP